MYRLWHRRFLDSIPDVGGTMHIIRNRVFHWEKWLSLPTLERLIFRNPWSLRMKRTRPAPFPFSELRACVAASTTLPQQAVPHGLSKQAKLMPTYSTYSTFKASLACWCPQPPRPVILRLQPWPRRYTSSEKPNHLEKLLSELIVLVSQLDRLTQKLPTSLH